MPDLVQMAMGIGKIDFEGQKLVEKVYQIALAVLTLLSFVVGFALQDLRLTVGLFGGGVLVLFIALLPPWPKFNEHPVTWLPVKRKLEPKKQK
ncbi:microsomal signal peptidase 12kDa subunit [Vararia minispora EC-137]|uniref:Microsomal signal peptidase 12kDa subunit n=1 Tax=Vararia minispora EC-137 TaxID=1314806 RepID=A0ACB8QBM5_9AGAM|nr:microsomal signal peptidase 12kDa subunit [Vararia minispora EC-137]